jgi:Galactose oxidase, central domain
MIRASRLATTLAVACGLVVQTKLATADGTWSTINVGTIGDGVGGCRMIYDPVANRVVLFGGEVFPGPSEILWTPWALGSSADDVWQPLADNGNGGTRSRASMTYDPMRHRMLLFGGDEFGHTPKNDVRSLDLGSLAWTGILPAGPLPPPRHSHTAIYDPARNRLIVYGGSNLAPNDVWALSLSGTPTWTQLAPAGTPPSPRLGHVAVYDEIRDRMLVFSGQTGGVALNDVWSLSLGGTPTWTPISTMGGTPISRHLGGGVFDATYDRLVVFGGVDGSARPNAPWELRFSGDGLTGEWVQLPFGPSGRYSFGTAHDVVGQRMIVAYGYWGGTSTWSLSLDQNPTWQEIFPGHPGRAVDQTAIYDAPRDRMVVFGDLPGGPWVLTMGHTTWSRLTTIGTPPAARTQHTSICDSVRERMIVFGGNATNELWSLTLAGVPTWSPLLASGTPPSPRNNHSAIYDPDGDRMIVFGGSGATALNDIWELSLSGPTPVWTQLNPTGTPPSPRARHVAIHDPVRKQMIVQGGYDKGVWSLSLLPTGSPQWTTLSPSGTPPQWAPDAVAIYDPIRDRMVVHGGGSMYQSDAVTALSLAGPPSWSELEPTISYGRGTHTGIYDPIRDRLVIHGGYYRGGVFTAIDHTSARAYTWSTPTGVEPTSSSVAFRVGIVPNPAVRRFNVDFVLPSAGRAVVELLDPMGRRLQVRDLATASAGRHSVALEGRGLKPGIYWVRVTHGEKSAASRVALIE